MASSMLRSGYLGCYSYQMDSRGDQNAGNNAPQLSDASPSPPDIGDSATMPPEAEERAHRNGAILKRRREQRGLTLRAAARIAGLTHPSLSRVESGGSAPRAIHYPLLDQAYGYTDGSVRDLYELGQEPTPIETLAPADQHRVLTDPPRVPTEVFPVPLPLQDMLDLIQADQALADKLQNVDDAELLVVRETVGRCTDRLLRAWILAQVEGRRAAGVVADPFVKTLLAVQLTRKPISPDEHDRDELTYLRWLLGDATDLSTEDQARYTELFTMRTQGRPDVDA